MPSAAGTAGIAEAAADPNTAGALLSGPAKGLMGDGGWPCARRATALDPPATTAARPSTAIRFVRRLHCDGDRRQRRLARPDPPASSRLSAISFAGASVPV